MKKFFKVVLWVVGIIAVLVIILIGTGVYIGVKSNPQEANNAGVAFAATSDKEGCLSETAIRLAKCDGTLCVETLTFGAACLVSAKGSQQVFCADKPTSAAEYSKGSWQQHCSSNSLSKHKCEFLFNTFSAYCRGEFTKQ